MNPGTYVHTSCNTEYYHSYSKLRSIDSSTIKRSVRFQDMPSSKGAEPMGEPLPLTYDTDSEDEQVTNADIQKVVVDALLV